MAEKLKLVLGRFENIAGKGENAGYQHFLLFPQCFQQPYYTGSLPNDKFLDWAKLKVFADDKINMTEKLKLVLGWAENIVGKGENAGYQHFLLFPQCFQKPSYTGSLKVVIV